MLKSCVHECAFNFNVKCFMLILMFNNARCNAGVETVWGLVWDRPIELLQLKSETLFG